MPSRNRLYACPTGEGAAQCARAFFTISTSADWSKSCFDSILVSWVGTGASSRFLLSLLPPRKYSLPSGVRTLLGGTLPSGCLFASAPHAWKAARLSFLGFMAQGFHGSGAYLSCLGRATELEF